MLASVCLKLPVKRLNQSIGKADFGNEYFFRIGPAHHVDIDLQGRNDYICPVFSQIIKPHPFRHGKTVEFFIIIFQQFQRQRFAVFSFGE